MALALPYATPAGRPFPGRSLIVAVAFGVILTTLVIQGLTLRPIIKWPRHSRAIFRSGRKKNTHRLAAAHAAMKRIDELAAHEALASSAAGHLRSDIVQRTRLALDEIAHVRTARWSDRRRHHATRGTRRRATPAGTPSCACADAADAIGDEAMRRVLDDLDGKNYATATSPSTRHLIGPKECGSRQTTTRRKHGLTKETDNKHRREQKAVHDSSLVSVFFVSSVPFRVFVAVVVCAVGTAVAGHLPCWRLRLSPPA